MKYLIKREDEERRYQARYLIKDGVLVMLMTEDLGRLIRCDLCHKNNGCCFIWTWDPNRPTSCTACKAKSVSCTVQGVGLITLFQGRVASV
jgi:hypothetical protein